MTDNPQQPPATRARPRGRALRHSDAELDALSEVSPEDIQRAIELVEAHGSERLKGLMKAKGTGKGGRKK